MWATHLYPNGSQIKNEDHILLHIYIYMWIWWSINMYKSQAKLFTPLGYLLQHLFCCSKHANAANGNPWKFLWIICNMGPCLFSSPSMVNLCHFPWKNPWKHPFSMGKIWENHDQNMIKTIGFSDFPVVFRWFSSPSGVVPVVWRPGVAGIVCWPLQSRSWKIRNIPGERWQVGFCFMVLFHDLWENHGELWPFSKTYVS